MVVLILASVAPILVTALPAAATTVVMVSGNAAPGSNDPLTTVSTSGFPLKQAVVLNPQLFVPGGFTPPAQAIGWFASGASLSAPRIYRYTRTFTLPPCILAGARVNGDVYANDTVTVRLNGPVIGSAALPNAGTFAGTNLVTGTNTLTFDVSDVGGGTFLAYRAILNFEECPKGLVKVCKVAGPGVALNAPFTFSAGGQSVTVPAGPAPGGFCKPFPQAFYFGPLTIQESVPPLHQVVNPIQVLPPSRLNSQNAPGGNVTINVGSGVTEVIFTNRGPGYLEVCKETQPANTTQMFTFTVQGPVGPAQTATIPGGGTCSPPLQVASGNVQVTETVPTGWQMTNQCYTLPNASLLVSCNQVTHVAVATVAGGDVSTQTLLYFRNVCVAPGCGSAGSGPTVTTTTTAVPPTTVPPTTAPPTTSTSTTSTTVAPSSTSATCVSLARQLETTTDPAARQAIQALQVRYGCQA